MRDYKGNRVFVTEDECKFLCGGFEFPTDDKANGYDRARAYLTRPLNAGTDERLYSFAYAVRKAGRVYKLSFTTQQVLDAVDKAERGETRVLRIDRKGRLEVKQGTGIEFLQTFGRPVHCAKLEAKSLDDLRVATKARFNAAAKGWELECRAAWAADDATVAAFYVGSFEDQRTHDLRQACDNLIYSTRPLRKAPPSCY